MRQYLACTFSIDGWEKLGNVSFEYKRKAFITIALLAGVVILAVTGKLNPAVSIPLAAMLAIAFGCVKVKDAYDSVNWQAVVTVAGH